MSEEDSVPCIAQIDCLAITQAYSILQQKIDKQVALFQSVRPLPQQRRCTTIDRKIEQFIFYIRFSTFRFISSFKRSISSPAQMPRVQMRRWAATSYKYKNSITSTAYATSSNADHRATHFAKLDAAQSWEHRRFSLLCKRARESDPIPR